MSIKLEAGKYYRTRDGRKAYVAAVQLPNPFEHTSLANRQPVRGFIERDHPSAFSWSVDGFYNIHNEPTHYDLIAEWREPRVFERDVYFYENHCGEVFVSCSGTFSGKLLARVHVKAVEGEGVPAQEVQAKEEGEGKC